MARLMRCYYLIHHAATGTRTEGDLILHLITGVEMPQLAHHEMQSLINLECRLQHDNQILNVKAIRVLIEH
jgi:hypothetical protein